METFKKNDLVYEHNWSHYEKNDPRISGMPDATEFNRKEGWESLYIINFLADHVAWGVKFLGNKMEKLVHDRLPGISRIKKTQFDGLKTTGRISLYTSIDDVQRDALVTIIA